MICCALSQTQMVELMHHYVMDAFGLIVDATLQLDRVSTLGFKHNKYAQDINN